MDSVTHIALAGACGLALGWRKLGPWAFAAAAVAGTLPDLDMFWPAKNAAEAVFVHRSFSHSFLLAPVLALISTLLFMGVKRLRRSARWIYATSLVAILSHVLLDAATSYGTLLLWPFSRLRVSWDWIAIVDPLYTLPLIAGIVWTLARKDLRGAMVGLVVSTMYLGLGVVQHERALATQKRVALARGHTGLENARVMPQIGSLLNYRSVYVHGGMMYADALRVPPLGSPQVRMGEQAALVREENLAAGTHAEAHEAFREMQWFADGFVGRRPGDTQVLGDMRYAVPFESMGSLWGIRVEGTDEAQWMKFTRSLKWSGLWREIVNPRGYVPVDHVQSGLAP